MSGRVVVLVFAKPPVAGVSKTRLARGVGPARAAEFAGAFLADTWSALARLPWVTPILATTDAEAHFDLPGEEARWLQGEGDLGARLERLFRRGLGLGHPAVIAIGADSPGLPLQRFEEARQALLSRDAAVVPTDDGGYALLGLRTCPEGLLRDLPWSAPNTGSATVKRLESRGLSVVQLESWFDIDEEADLQQLRERVEPAAAPRTFALLDHG